MILAVLMLRFVLVLFAALRAALYSRTDLVIENLALRQQLAVLAHTGRRGRLAGADRLFWVMLRRVWTRWSDVLVFVTRDRDPMAPIWVPQVLDLALETPAHRSPLHPMRSSREHRRPALWRRAAKGRPL